MALKTSPAGIALIKKYEGCVLHAYQDIVGVWTIGYGCTGARIFRGVVWSQHEADQALADRLATEFEPAVNALCAGVPTSQGQFDALVSLSYNVGTGAEKRSSVIALHRAGKYDEAADAFEKYDHAGGVEVDALLRRRVEEGQMYLDASPDAATATIATPPVPAGVTGNSAAAVLTQSSVSLYHRLVNLL